MKPKRKKFRGLKAQTAAELMVFGAIVVFILGIIIRQSLNSNYAQDAQMKALRLAFRQSFQEAEAGNASRNVASVIFIEDRKTAEVNEYGTLARVPYVVGATGSFSKNLFMPVDWQEQESLPVMDMFINGKQFTFTTAGFATHTIETDEYAYKIVPNVASSTEYDPNCSDLPDGAYHCFDLDRDGSIDVPASQRADFTWMWKAIKPTHGTVDFDSGENTTLDVDNDLKEELILEISEGADNFSRGDGEGPFGRDGMGGRHPGPEEDEDFNDRVWVHIIDQQAGDIDFTYDTRDSKRGTRRSGLTEAARVYTVTRPQSGWDGTYLALLNASSRQQQDQIDVVEREIQLANNTGRMCNSAENPNVEVCGNCFSGMNSVMTCFDPGTNILYIRSRILSNFGRIWFTEPQQ